MADPMTEYVYERMAGVLLKTQPKYAETFETLGINEETTSFLHIQ